MTTTTTDEQEGWVNAYRLHLAAWTIHAVQYHPHVGARLAPTQFFPRDHDQDDADQEDPL